MGETIEIKPQQGPQTETLSSPADIVIMGGAAGGGKTWALLLEPVRHIHNPAFGCLIFRRSYKQVTQEGGMWDESGSLYPYLGATPNQNDLAWTFPTGAKVSFGHMQHETSKYNYKGAQIALIGFDQLEDFTESQFFYMLSRNRSTCGVKPYIRATCNPDPDSFLAHFLEWWIDQETGYAIEERGGVIRWFIRVGTSIIWADNPAELEGKGSKDAMPKSVTFIPAKLEDNKILMEADPGYKSNLLSMDLIDQERLHKGNWKIKPEAGKVFNRGWFEIVDAAPAGGEICRRWDFASTKKELAKDDPDATASVKIKKLDGVYYILDCTEEWEAAARVETTFKNISFQDNEAAKAEKATYKVRFEREPGSASIRDARRLVQMVDGLDAQGIPSRGDKLTRAKALAAQSLAGNVKVLKGPWNERWLNHMHNQPAAHDDIMDASSGGYNDLQKPMMGKARSMDG